MCVQRIASPWGEPSAPLRIGDIDGLPIVFLSRHDKGHRLSPTDINYRANIYVLKRAGVTDIDLASRPRPVQAGAAPGSSCSSINSSTARLTARSSFFGTGCVAHVSMAHPVSPLLRIHSRRPRRPKASRSRGRHLCLHRGPAILHLAECLTYKGLGYSVVGMTNLPEAKLAREAEISYASVAMVTDFYCWHLDHDEVEVQEVIEVVQANAAG